MVAPTGTASVIWQITVILPLEPLEHFLLENLPSYFTLSSKLGILMVNSPFLGNTFIHHVDFVVQVMGQRPADCVTALLQTPLPSPFYLSSQGREGKAVCSPLCKQNTIPVFCLLSGARSPSVHGQEHLHLSSVQFSHSVIQSCPTLWPHGLQHARPPCPSPTPAAFSNSCPSSQWCHPIISSSFVRFSSRLQSFPASGSFQMSHFFASGGWSIEISASASVLSMNMQDWFPLGLTGLISLQSKELSRVFSNTTVEKHQFFSTQLSLWSNSHIHTWLLEKP